MKWPTVLAGSAVALSLTACDKIPFLGKRGAPADTVAAVPDSARLAVAAAESVAAAQAMATPVQASPPRQPLVDEPWTPMDTGTVVPGMARDQVITVWGIPVAERTVGNRTYLYFRNGCEVTCGTFDVVFLEDSQVVDAIVRGQGHTYAGTSSSPPDRLPTANTGQPAAAPPPEAAPQGGSEAEMMAAAMDQRYRSSIETPEGQTYEPIAVAAFWGDAAFMQTCAPPGGPAPQPFTIYFEVLQTGQLGLVVFNPETDVARCIGGAVAGRTFPSPPGTFVGRIDMTFQP